MTSSGLLYSVDTSTLTIPVLAKQSIMLRKRTSVKNLKVKAIKDYNYGSRYGHPDWYYSLLEHCIVAKTNNSKTVTFIVDVLSWAVRESKLMAQKGQRAY